MASRVEEGTLLHFACRGDYADLVNCLLEHGADVMEKCVLGVLAMYNIHCFLFLII